MITAPFEYYAGVADINALNRCTIALAQVDVRGITDWNHFYDIIEKRINQVGCFLEITQLLDVSSKYIKSRIPADRTQMLRLQNFCSGASDVGYSKKAEVSRWPCR